MNTEKKIPRRMFLWPSLAVLVLLTCSSFLISRPSDEVYAAAFEGMPYFLNAIPEGMEKSFGFSSREEFEKASLGEPYLMQTVDPEKLLNTAYRERDCIISLPEWRFPVICEGNIKTLLTVANINGTWQAVAIGGAGLARELDALEKKYGFDPLNSSKAILRLFQLKADILSVSETGERWEDGLFFPLSSALVITGSSRQEDAFYFFDELLPILKEQYLAVWPYIEKDPQNNKGKRGN
ncbi:MAG: hypothetical protein JXB26_19320 [Candidatus Aminicenantes bacterium]|nr:hypothetical protein [Candidatus Aminicenantes bacterium]